MNRRGFIQSLGTLVGGVLLDKVIPFNRVWSFPSKVVIPNWKIIDDWSDSDYYSVIRTDYVIPDVYGIILTEKNSMSLINYDHPLLG